MPTHWDSAKRPLFVRTVVVNGNRHAILSQEDPLSQPAGTFSRKHSRPNSCQSYVSTSSVSSAGSWEDRRRRAEQQPPSDLQACLVKLRLVLAKHDSRPKTNSEKCATTPPKPLKPAKTPVTAKQKRKKSNGGKTSKKKSLRYDKPAMENDKSMEGYPEQSQFYRYESSYYIIDTGSELSNGSQPEGDKEVELQEVCTCPALRQLAAEEPQKEDLEKPSKPSHDIPWNSVSSDSYFTRPYYNPLSERVMQWLDLASKRIKSIARPDNPEDEVKPDTVERIFEGQTFLDEKNMSKYRDRTRPRKQRVQRSRSEVKVVRRDASCAGLKETSGPTEEEDVEEGVRQEEDVETVLSTEVEYPKYSKELNKMHSLKEPEGVEEKEKVATTVTEPEPPPEKPEPSERRAVLVRQPKLREESDSDDDRLKSVWPRNQTSVRQRRTAFSHRNNLFTKPVDPKPRREPLKRAKPEKNNENREPEEGPLEIQCKPICPQVPLSPRLQNRIPWLRDYQTGGKNMWPSDRATSKPQLHIFMPAMPPKESDSAAEREDREDGQSDCESCVSEETSDS